MTQRSTILLVDTASLPPSLEATLAETFVVETALPGQVSGTLLISAPKAIVAAQKHLDEVGRAIRSSATQLELPCLILAPAADLTKLQGRAPREVTAIIGDDVAPSAILVRLETAIEKASTRRERPRTLMGVGSLGPSKESIEAAVAQAKQRLAVAPAPPSTSSPAPLPTQPRPKPLSSAASRLVPEDEWIRPSRPPPPPVAKPKNQRLEEERSAVGLPAAEVLKLRIALIDDDITRADAISASLRALGHVVFLAAATAANVRWPLLRQFAPQAIVAEPRSLSTDANAWTEAVTRDAFLRQTPLVTCSYSALFNVHTGVADPSKLFAQLEGIGQAELEFGTALATGETVEVDRAHINPGRLLALLTELRRAVTITCAVDGETMSWKIAAGLAGPAQVLGTGGTSSLTAPQALNRLLDRPNAKIVVRARSDLRVKNGHDVFELLEQAYRSHLPAALISASHRDAWTDEDAELETRSYPNAAAHLALYPSSSAPDSETPTRPVHISQVPRGPGLRPSAPPPLPQGALPSAGVPQAGASQTPPTRPPPPPSVPPPPAPLPAPLPSARPLIESIDAIPEPEPPVIQPVIAPGAPRHFIPSDVSQILGDSPATPIRPALKWGVASAVVLTLGGVGYWLSVERAKDALPQPDPSASIAPITAPAQPRADEPEPTAPPAKDAPIELPGVPIDEEEALWKVESPTDLPDCESLLGKKPEAFAGLPRWRADLAWKNARKKLMSGQKDEANKFMCESAFIDPSGQATPGLVSLYLGERALKQAHRWALVAVEQRPEASKKSKEILGDVLSQMGEQEEARALWLQTLQLEDDNDSKLQAVSRSLVKSAASVRKGGDAPLAERLLRRACALDEDNADAASSLSAILHMNEQPHLAKEWAKKAIALEPEAAEAHIVLGDLAASAGDMEAARTHYETVPEKTVYHNRAQERLKQL